MQKLNYNSVSNKTNSRITNNTHNYTYSSKYIPYTLIHIQNQSIQLHSHTHKLRHTNIQKHKQSKNYINNQRNIRSLAMINRHKQISPNMHTNKITYIHTHTHT